MKRGQLTIFIIIAVLIVILIGLYFYIDFEQEKFVEGSFEDLIFFEDIFHCIDSLGEEAVNVIGIQGGYYKKTQYYLTNGENFLSYYYYEGETRMPLKKDIEESLAEFMNNKISSCLNFNLNYTKPNTKVFIEEKEIIFEVDTKVYYEKQDKNFVVNLKERPIFKESSLHDILEIAEYITFSHNEDEKTICINCLDELATKKNVYVDFIDFDEDEVMVILSDNYTLTDKFSFVFLNKYNGDEIYGPKSQTVEAPRIF